ncbi:MAG: hypothetical protein F7B20_06915 [Aeropyrum sp.]|nr:hypothetical protein [Aeropyrum sp.]MCE4616088.1 hypothetical protein [Aeropyrum sp.]
MGISWFEARVAVHATEDREKVLKALSSVVPTKSEGVEVVEDVFEGHYGNPIRILTIRVKSPRLAEDLLKSVLDRLPEHDVKYLLSTLDERVDKSGALYLRVSKQDAFHGEIRIFEGDDVIRLSIGFKGGRKRALEYFRALISNYAKP